MTTSALLTTSAKQSPEPPGKVTSGRPFPRDWKIASALFVVSLVCLLPLLGSYKLLDPSDAWYSEGAREMVELGNYLTPHLNYQGWYEKPIVTFWLICASYKLLGVSEFAARFPSAILQALLTCFGYLFCRRYMSLRASLLSALIILTSPLIAALSRLSLTDMPLSFFVSVALACGFSALESKKGSSWIFLFVFAGLAVLTKGPIGIVLPFLGIGAYLVWTSPSLSAFWGSIKRLRVLPGVFISFLVAVPWFVAETLATKGLFYQEFFVRQNLARATGHLDHVFPFWFYLPVILGGLFPWSLYALSFCRAGVTLLQRRFSQLPQARLTIYAFFSALTIIALFSAIPSKLPTYILPAFPALAVFAGSLMDYALRLKAKRALVVGTTLAMTVLLGGSFVAFHFARTTSDQFYAIPVLASAVIALWAAASVLFFEKKANAGLVYLGIGALFGSALLVPFGLRTYSEVFERGQAEVVSYAKQNKLDVVLFDRYLPYYIFYLQKHEFAPHTLAEVVAYVQAHPRGAYVITGTKLVHYFAQANLSVSVLKESGPKCICLLRQMPQSSR